MDCLLADVRWITASANDLKEDFFEFDEVAFDDFSACLDFSLILEELRNLPPTKVMLEAAFDGLIRVFPPVSEDGVLLAELFRSDLFPELFGNSGQRLTASLHDVSTVEVLF